VIDVIVSICRAMSERVTFGPEGASNANTVQATIETPAIQAKANMGPRMIGVAVGKIISTACLVSKPGSDAAPITKVETLVFRSALDSLRGRFSKEGRFLETERA